MIERKMGYRGSKSVSSLSVVKQSGPTGQKLDTVKEQRVDGSWCIKKFLMHLRYTLMGFEKNYLIKIPSKQKKSYSTKTNFCALNHNLMFKNKLNP